MGSPFCKEKQNEEGKRQERYKQTQASLNSAGEAGPPPTLWGGGMSVAGSGRGWLWREKLSASPRPSHSRPLPTQGISPTGPRLDLTLCLKSPRPGSPCLLNTPMGPETPRELLGKSNSSLRSSALALRTQIRLLPSLFFK